MNDVSPFVVHCLSRIGEPASGVALDLPCGWGRHTELLMSHGYRVIAADIDAQRVRFTHENTLEKRPGCVAQAVVLDAERALPIAPQSIDVAVVVDYMSFHLFTKSVGLLDTLAPGGFLIFQTFGAHGQNWLALPKAGSIKSLLGEGFQPVTYQEKSAGPLREGRVTVRGLFRRR